MKRGWRTFKRSVSVGFAVVFLLGAVDALSHTQFFSPGLVLTLGVLAMGLSAMIWASEGWWMERLGWRKKGEVE